MPNRPPIRVKHALLPLKKAIRAYRDLVSAACRLPHPDSLISEHETEQEALDAKQRYEDPEKS
jgi:hypothetical protein